MWNPERRCRWATTRRLWPPPEKVGLLMSNETMNAQFVDNLAFLEYRDLLVQIQHSICRGDNQTADRLCDASEDLGQSLSHAEVKWLQWLSSDLEMLCGEELLRPSNQSHDEYNKDLEQAWLYMQQDPEGVLRLLRISHNHMPLDRVAYARARAYGLLGYRNLFLEFMRVASQLNPAHTAYKVFLLDELKKQGRFDEVWALADAVFSDTTSSPFIVLQAAATVYMFTSTMFQNKSRSILGRLRREVQRVFDQNGSGALEPNVASFGFLLWAGILEGLNRKSEARDRYMQAMDAAPQDDAPLLALGSLLFNTRPDEAFSFYRRAIELGTRYALPYLLLALKELNNHNHQGCTDLAERVLAMTNTPDVRAHALELLALSGIEAAEPNEIILRHLGEAVSLAPKNDRIRQNYEAFLRMQDNKGQNPDSQRVELTLENFDADSLISELDARPKQLLSDRLTNFSTLSSKSENSRLAEAA